MEKHLFIPNCSAIIYNSDGQVLLAQRAMTEDVSPGKWGIPGGKLDHGDKSAESGLQREVLEEIGVEISDISLFESHVSEGSEFYKLYLVFQAAYKSGVPKALEDTATVRWFKQSELPEEPLFTPKTYKLVQQFFKLVLK